MTQRFTKNNEKVTRCWCNGRRRTRNAERNVMEYQNLRSQYNVPRIISTRHSKYSVYDQKWIQKYLINFQGDFCLFVYRAKATLDENK